MVSLDLEMSRENLSDFLAEVGVSIGQAGIPFMTVQLNDYQLNGHLEIYFNPGNELKLVLMVCDKPKRGVAGAAEH